MNLPVTYTYLQYEVYMCIHTHSQGVQNLTPKILEAISLTKDKTKMFYDEIPFNASVSIKTFLNVRNVATSHF